jgi:transposase InsO family protein
LAAIDDARRKGLTEARACETLVIEPSRVQRWRRWQVEGRSLADEAPGWAPGEAPHALLPEEREAVAALGREERYAELSAESVAAKATDEGRIAVSASVVRQIWKEEGLVEARQRRPRPKQERPEVRPTGPRQVWSWDLTYLKVGPFVVYLVAILDVWSRKVVGWNLDWTCTVEMVKRAWDEALASEGLLAVGGVRPMPVSLSDHGTQMTAKSMRQFFRDLGIGQLFARYQTPQDNAWIESWFSQLKERWLRLKDAASFDDLRTLLRDFVEFYNQVRPHGSVGYVTPAQKHSGEAETILARRKERRAEARRHRMETRRKVALDPAA